MRSVIIGFAGKIGSGKTRVSAAVAEVLKWKRTSFGDFVRGIARQKGLEPSREILQEIGASLVKDPEAFCRSVLQLVDWKPGENLVIDGIRHVKIIEELRRITTPSVFLLVLLKIDEGVRRQRLLDTKNLERQIDLNYDTHTTEADVNTILPVIADLVLDGGRPLGDLVHEIVPWIQNKKHSASSSKE